MQYVAERKMYLWLETPKRNLPRSMANYFRETLPREASQFYLRVKNGVNPILFLLNKKNRHEVHEKQGVLDYGTKPKRVEKGQTEL